MYQAVSNTDLTHFFVHVHSPGMRPYASCSVLFSVIWMFLCNEMNMLYLIKVSSVIQQTQDIAQGTVNLCQMNYNYYAMVFY